MTDLETRLEEVAELKERLVIESPLKDQTAKSVLAESVALQIVYLRSFLIPRALDGALTSETLRTIPGVSAHIRRGLDALGLTKPVEEVIPDFFGKKE